GLGAEYSVKRQVFGSKAAILLPRCSVTYNRASEAQAMPCGRPSAVGTDHSVNLSVRGSNRPSLLAPISANQMRPSGAATRQWGALFGVGMAYSTSVAGPPSQPTPAARRVMVRMTQSFGVCETSDVRRLYLPANPVILIPSTTNCTAIAHSTRPINRVRIRIPVWP